MRLLGLLLWVQDITRGITFFQDGLGLPAEAPQVFLPDGTVLRLGETRPSCTTRGPHGLVPALEVENIAQAKSWLRHINRPIVFEEVLPGLARLTFLEPEGNPIDLVQPTEIPDWERGQHIPTSPTPHPPVVRGLFEVSVYVQDVGRALAFYRDALKLETGLMYFAHYHLLFENVPLVLRPTWHRCTQLAPHTPALLVQGPFACPPDFRPPHQPYEGRPTCWDGEHTWVIWMSPTSERV